MAWKKRSTCASVEHEVDLDVFDTEQIIQVLIDRDAIDDAVAEKILARVPLDWPDDDPADLIDDDEARDLAEARDEMRRGRIGEALVHVERALGADFIGRLTCLVS